MIQSLIFGVSFFEVEVEVLPSLFYVQGCIPGMCSASHQEDVDRWRTPPSYATAGVRYTQLGT